MCGVWGTIPHFLFSAEFIIVRCVHYGTPGRFVFVRSMALFLCRSFLLFLNFFRGSFLVIQFSFVSIFFSSHFSFALPS